MVSNNCDININNNIFGVNYHGLNKFEYVVVEKTGRSHANNSHIIQIKKDD